MTGASGPALIVVDMQNAFAEALDAATTPDGTVVQRINARIDDTAEAGRPVFYTRDVEPGPIPPGDPDRLTELVDDLHVCGPVLDKGPGRDGGMSGFVLSRDLASGGLSELALALRESGVDAVTVVGVAADVCVAATARDALRLGYAVTVDVDATAFVHAHPDGDDAAMAELTAAGVRVIPAYAPEDGATHGK